MLENRKKYIRFTARKGCVRTKYLPYHTYNTKEQLALIILFIYSTWITGEDGEKQVFPIYKILVFKSLLQLETLKSHLFSTRSQHQLIQLASCHFSKQNQQFLARNVIATSVCNQRSIALKLPRISRGKSGTVITVKCRKLQQQ